MTTPRPSTRGPQIRRLQRGVGTLAITLLLLVIISVIVLFSTNVAFFEQRTATNQNRSLLAEQAADFALNLSGEWIKSNMTNLVSTGTNGWLASGGSRRWVLCSTVSPMAATHPCMSEQDATRRNQLYFYSVGAGVTATELPYATMGGGITTIGGATGNVFAVTTAVNAVLCRLDTTLSDPDCRAIPDARSANRVAITLVTSTGVDTDAAAQMKETWASYSGATGTSAVPLLASGTVAGLGNAQIVTAANGAGYGLPVSIWTPCQVDIEESGGVTPAPPQGACEPAGGGIGSVSTCQVSEFLDGTPETGLKTTCVTTNSCNCGQVGEPFLSGHVGGTTKESEDILDRDSNRGLNAQGQPIPDIQFFPGAGLDSATDPLDDSLFEWIFGQDVVSEGGTTVNTNCGPAANENCVKVAMRDTFGATMLTDCSTLSATSTGTFYVEGDCNLPSAIGSATNSVIVVVKDSDAAVTVGSNTNFYGMLFITSDQVGPRNPAQATLTGHGNPTVVGSLVIEGGVSLSGGITIIYDNANTDTPGNPLPPNTRFAKVAGSWLDSRSGF